MREKQQASEVDIQAREIALVQLWQKGLDTPDSIGFQYTTLEAMQHMIKYGGIPGHTKKSYDNPSLPQKGDLYFFPRMNTFPFAEYPNLFDANRLTDHSEHFRLQIAQDRAREIAIVHRICSYLGFDIAEYGETVDAYFMTDKGSEEQRDAFVTLQQLQLTYGKLAVVRAIAQKRKGILIGVKANILQLISPSSGDSGDDFRLSPGSAGLPPEALSGLLALGPEENAYFEELQRKYTVSRKLESQ